MASATVVNLSRHDSSVLGALFDPEASLQNHARIGSTVPGPYSTSTLSLIKNKEASALRLINAEQPKPEDVGEAITQLDEIIETFPKYASAWNNRAQAQRLLYDSGSTNDRLGLLRGSLFDLAKAIELTTPKKMLLMTSPDDAKVLATAHTHRGYLLWRASRSATFRNDLNKIESFHALNEDQLEEMASKDFSLGGKYGNQTAQQLAVKTNPYAKLCGSIVREALQKEIKDFRENQI